MSVTPVPEPLLEFAPIPPELADALARVDGLRARWDADQRDGRVPANTREAIRVELTYHSNAIEGNTLTLRETQLVIEGQTPPSGKPLREIYEARNHDRALRKIENDLSPDGSAAPLAEETLLQIHATLLADIDADAGQFRSERVLIAGTRFVPPGSHRFAELLPAVFDMASRAGVHPVVQAAELHYNLAAVHPFRDGNGRTARLAMNRHLLSSGYPLTIIDVTRRGEYLAGLDEANAGQWERFGLFISASVEQSIGRLLA